MRFRALLSALLLAKVARFCNQGPGPVIGARALKNKTKGYIHRPRGSRLEARRQVNARRYLRSAKCTNGAHFSAEQRNQNHNSGFCITPKRSACCLYSSSEVKEVG